MLKKIYHHQPEPLRSSRRALERCTTRAAEFLVGRRRCGRALGARTNVREAAIHATRRSRDRGLGRRLRDGRSNTSHRHRQSGATTGHQGHEVLLDLSTTAHLQLLHRLVAREQLDEFGDAAHAK